MQRWLFLLLLTAPLLTASVLAAAVMAEGVLDWQQLIPEGYQLDKNALFGGRDISDVNDFSPEGQQLMDLLQQALNAAPPVEALDGQQVALAGFMVPLQRQGSRVTEFFLVPYYGSCIHTPPPPANQMVRVLIEEGSRFNRLFSTVRVTGQLQLKYTEHRLGTSAYMLRAEEIEAQEFELRRR